MVAGAKTKTSLQYLRHNPMWLGPAWSNKEGEKCSDLGYILKVSFREFASGSDAGRDREKIDSKFFALRFWNGR